METSEGVKKVRRVKERKPILLGDVPVAVETGTFQQPEMCFQGESHFQDISPGC